MIAVKHGVIIDRTHGVAFVQPGTIEFDRRSAGKDAVANRHNLGHAIKADTKLFHAYPKHASKRAFLNREGAK